MSNCNIKYEFKGTPGPWVQTRGSYHFIDGPENYNIDEEGRHSIAELYGPDAPANKALFLASTALLSALIKAVEDEERMAASYKPEDGYEEYPYPVWYHAAKEAIAAAGVTVKPVEP